MIPQHLLYGVDVAIKRLRPHAEFQLSNTTFTNWHDPSGMPPPSWQEVLDQLERDKLAYETWLTDKGE